MSRHGPSAVLLTGLAQDHLASAVEADSSWKRLWEYDWWISAHANSVCQENAGWSVKNVRRRSLFPDQVAVGKWEVASWLCALILDKHLLLVYFPSMRVHVQFLCMCIIKSSQPICGSPMLHRGGKWSVYDRMGRRSSKCTGKPRKEACDWVWKASSLTFTHTASVAKNITAAETSVPALSWHKVHASQYQLKQCLSVDFKVAPGLGVACYWIHYSAEWQQQLDFILLFRLFFKQWGLYENASRAMC